MVVAVDTIMMKLYSSKSIQSMQEILINCELCLQIERNLIKINGMAKTVWMANWCTKDIIYHLIKYLGSSNQMRTYLRAPHSHGENVEGIKLNKQELVTLLACNWKLGLWVMLYWRQPKRVRSERNSPRFCFCLPPILWGQERSRTLCS